MMKQATELAGGKASISGAVMREPADFSGSIDAAHQSAPLPSVPLSTEAARDVLDPFVLYVKTHSPLALAAVHEKYGQHLLKVARAVIERNNLVGKVDPNDPVQDLYRDFLRKAPSFDIDRSPKAFLNRCAANMATTHCRRYRTFKMASTDVPTSQDNEDILLARDPKVVEPMDALQNREEDQRFRDAIQILPEHYQKPIELHLEGRTQRAIADILNKPHGTIKSRIHKGTEKLRQILADDAE